MLNVWLLPATGGEYLISGAVSSSPVLLIEEQLENLVGQLQRADSALPGRSGSFVGMGRYGMIQAELDFYLHADDGAGLADVYAQFRQGWSVHTPSVIRMETDHPLSPLEIDVFLDRRIPGVPVDMTTRTTTTVTVPVVAPRGLWRSQTMRQSGPGTVTIRNLGDDTIYPTLTYEGQGKTITSPSGATFILPAADTTARVSLDPFELKLDGVFPEGIKPGLEADWVIPTGVSLEWVQHVADPYA